MSDRLILDFGLRILDLRNSVYFISGCTKARLTDLLGFAP